MPMLRKESRPVLQKIFQHNVRDNKVLAQTVSETCIHCSCHFHPRHRCCELWSIKTLW